MQTSAAVPIPTMSVILILFSLIPQLLGRLLAELAVHQISHELNALEVQQLRVFLHVAVQRRADLPGPRKYFWVLNGGFIPKDAGTAGRVAFDDVKSIAMIVSRAVEPGALVEPGHIHHQRVAFPMASRLAHP